jgi:hypothetical protein
MDLTVIHETADLIIAGQQNDLRMPSTTTEYPFNPIDYIREDKRALAS